jgi:K(+)-stimulated pyrophosphate-energized sodium pump
MVLGNWRHKDMGGSISDAFGIGPILLPMSIAGLEFYLNHRNNDRKKFPDDNAKEKQVQSAFKY